MIYGSKTHIPYRWNVWFSAFIILYISQGNKPHLPLELWYYSNDKVYLGKMDLIVDIQQIQLYVALRLSAVIYDEKLLTLAPNIID